MQSGKHTVTYRKNRLPPSSGWQR